MKIITVLGARPQFIKASAISRELKQKSNVQEIIIHTGQHFDSNMSEIFFKELGLDTPKYHLNINNLGHGAMTGKMLEGIEKILLDERPNIVLVYGDTNSTLAGALAAAKLHIPIAHIEAGLRSFNKKMPEEINRILTDQISDFLFCPTQVAVDNLMVEGFSQKNVKIHLVGDVMLDTTLYAKKQKTDLSLLPFSHGPYAVITVHREENTDDIKKIDSLFKILDAVAAKIPIVFPVHPRIRKLIDHNQHKLKNIERIKLIDPLSYFPMISLITGAQIILTDSGGLQKEAVFLGKPCLILREETEWIELVQNEHALLCGLDKEKILQGLEFFKNKSSPAPTNLFGDGKSSKKIVDLLLT